MTQSVRDYLDKQIVSLRGEQSEWTSHWRDLTENFSPRKGKFSRTERRGGKKNNLTNNIPIFAKRTLTSGMMTGITSPARPWFRYGPPDPDMAEFGPVRGWLDIAERLTYQVFHSSNLYRILPRVYEGLVVIGDRPMLQDEDFENVAQFSTYGNGGYLIGTDEKGRVRRFAREFQMTVLQLVKKFGKDNTSVLVQGYYDHGDYDVKVDVNRLIEPVTSRDFPELKLDPEFEFRSVYWEVGRSDSNNFLGVKGYHEFPVHCPRWDVDELDAYASSPCMDALGDAKALQVQEREKGKAIAKMVSPPVVAPSSAKRANLSVLPGKFNYSNDPNQVFRPMYQVNPRVGELAADIERTEARINRALYVDLFMMLSQMEGIQPRNELELLQRQEEKLLQLGPVMEGVNDDLLDPLLNRTFNMLVRLSEPGWRGLTDQMVLPPPPEELQGGELKIEYISTLAQAQKQIGLQATERWVQFTKSVMEINPEVGDKINADQVVEDYAEDIGVPNNQVVSEGEVIKVRRARADQEAQLARTEQIAQGAAVAKDASQALGGLGG